MAMSVDEHLIPAVLTPETIGSGVAAVAILDVFMLPADRVDRVVPVVAFAAAGEGLGETAGAGARVDGVGVPGALAEDDEAGVAPVLFGDAGSGEPTGAFGVEVLVSRGATADGLNNCVDDGGAGGAVVRIPVAEGNASAVIERGASGAEELGDILGEVDAVDVDFKGASSDLGHKVGDDFVAEAEVDTKGADSFADGLGGGLGDVGGVAVVDNDEVGGVGRRAAGLDDALDAGRYQRKNGEDTHENGRCFHSCIIA